MITIKNIRSGLNWILFFAVLLFFSDMVCFAQTGGIQTDSTKISQDKTQSQAQNKNQGNNQKTVNGKAVKQVKSAKPDMSKAKGARPNIVRPSGSAIPKGAGKPGGVKRMGGR
ncbi:MAG: hypothetical protein A2V64_13610 [Bacteroidetes bacterium RBG_13_43_22]|nr:MAG: hypothetical protein A2V64_13610 [Bacteroidetes bacterium RBG_13_43_22]